MTIREMIADIQKEVRDTDLSPARASELLNQLSSLLGNVNDELKTRQMDYNKKLLKEMTFGTVDLVDGNPVTTYPTAARARAEAETSTQYEQLLEVKNTKELTLEMIRSLKYYLKSKLDEYREAKY